MGCCVFLALAGCATAQKEQVEMPVEAEMSISNTPDPEITPVEEEIEEEPEVVNSPVAGLEGLETWELIGDDSLVNEFYEVKTAVTETMDGSELRITVREALYDEMMDMEAAPMTLVTISTGGYEVRHPLYPDRRMDFEYALPKSRPQLLAISEHCGCVDPYADLVHLFTVYRGAIRPLGAVSGLDDAEADGLMDPFVYDTSFSGGLGMMESDSAPVVRFFYSVDKGRLVGDSRKYGPYYRKNIERLSDIIVKAHAESPDSGDIAPLLEKFLYYRAMGAEAEGWEALEADVMLYGEDGFPQLSAGDETPERISLEEIVSRARKALAKSMEDM